MPKCWIIEDEPPAQRQLKRALASVASNYEVVFICDSVEASIEACQTLPTPDLIFSDIELADGLSFSIWEQVHPACPIVFTTAYDQYSIRAFEVNSIDYLLKPIEEERLLKTIEKHEKLASSPNTMQELAKLINTKKPVYRQRFVVQHKQAYQSIPTTDFAHFYSDEGLTFGLTLDGQRHLLSQTIERLKTELAPTDWFRINRGQLVSASCVSKAEPYFNHRLKLSLKPMNEQTQESLVSRNRVKEFLSWWGK